MRAIVTAFRILTVIPMPGRDAASQSSALPYFPVVGGVLGLATAGAAMLVSDLTEWHFGAAAVALAVGTFLTGGLHLDGLGDVFDSMGVGTREKKLEVMKDPRAGTFGVIALVMCLLMKFISLAMLSQSGRILQVVAAVVAARTVQVMLVVFMRYARREPGTAAGIVAGSEVSHFVFALATGLTICGLGFGVAGLGVMAAGAIAGVFLMVWMNRVYGGVTGDLIGMGSECVETGCLMALAAMASRFAVLKTGVLL